MPKKRLLKLDIVHPRSYLERVQREWADLDRISLEEYRERLIALRSNYSDYYTHYLNESGEWEAEEYFLHDPVYQQKVAERIYGKAKYNFYKQARRIRRRLPYVQPLDMRHQIIKDYIAHYRPDVIFVRSQPVPSRFWQQFRIDALLVARLSARMPRRWHPNDFDLIYTDNPDFQHFFQLHGTPTILNDQGFDQRINAELIDRPKQYDATFVGGLGYENFGQRTDFMRAIAQRYEGFRWWGYWWHSSSYTEPMEQYPELARTYEGSTSGLEMYQIYRDSRIIVNDYVDTAGGIGFNQRMFEVMGVGSLLLTRAARNFEGVFPDDIFVTYDSLDDCLEKIAYYLDHPEEREAIAARGKAFIAERYGYERITAEFGAELTRRLATR